MHENEVINFNVEHLRDGIKRAWRAAYDSAFLCVNLRVLCVKIQSSYISAFFLQRRERKGSRTGPQRK